MSKTTLKSLPLEVLLGITENLIMQEYCRLLRSDKWMHHMLINNVLPHAFKIKGWNQALDHAIRVNNEVAVRQILELKLRKKPEEDSSLMNKILCQAISCGNSTTVEMLLEYGVSANPIAGEENDRLWSELIFYEDVGMLKILVKHGLDVNRPLNFDNKYPIHRAAEWGRDLCFIEALIGEGADIFNRPPHGPNACQWASSCGKERIAAFLSKEMEKISRSRTDAALEEFRNCPKIAAIFARGRLERAPRKEPR
ncbi:F-box domain and ankyrin repeat protein [Penicillium tannophilum]|nr:F-box domain and ankyrin repeat protein [Penicillium tannophilum]